MAPAELEAAVREQVATVLDPCGIHNGTRLTFTELGMIQSVEVDESGEVSVRLLLDDPVCIYLVDIVTSIQEAAARVPGVREVNVDIEGGEVWTPDRLSVEARAKMARWRAERLRRLPVLDRGKIA